MTQNKETGKYEWQYLNKDFWYELEAGLGEVSDVVIHEHDDKRIPITVYYKSNGVQKHAYFSNWKMIIQSFMYCLQEFNVLGSFREYKTNEQYDIDNPQTDKLCQS